MTTKSKKETAECMAAQKSFVACLWEYPDADIIETHRENISHSKEREEIDVIRTAGLLIAYSRHTTGIRATAFASHVCVAWEPKSKIWTEFESFDVVERAVPADYAAVLPQVECIDIMGVGGMHWETIER